MGVIDPLVTTLTMSVAAAGPPIVPSAVTAITHSENPYYNKGFIRRAKLLMGANGNWQLFIPVAPMFDTLEDDVASIGSAIAIRLVVGPNNTNQLLQKALTPVNLQPGVFPGNTTRIYGMPTNTNVYSLQFQAINWYLPFLVTKDEFRGEILSRMVKEPKSVTAFKKWNVYPFPQVVPGAGGISASTLTVNVIIQTNSYRPLEVYVFAQFSGLLNDTNQIMNSQTFFNLAPFVQSAQIGFGGEYFPQNPYSTIVNTVNAGPAVPYQTWLNMSNRETDLEGGSVINYNSFNLYGNYFVLPFDLRHSRAGSAFSSGQNSDINLIMKLAPGIPNNLGQLNVMALVASEGMISSSYIDGRILKRV